MAAAPSSSPSPKPDAVDRPGSGVEFDPLPARERILDAALAVLAREGIAGVSMRAVARQADVAVGLANYHFENKDELVATALRRIGKTDIELVTPEPGLDPIDALENALRRAVDPVLLSTTYLSLRLQLWSLAGVDERFAGINRTAQRRYLRGLADLIEAARPNLARDEVERRAADVLIEQNGVWLTAVLIPDDDAVARSTDRCLAMALA